MTTDARLSVGLPGHPKTKRLIRRLGDGAAWKLVCLILWAAANRSDGQLTSMTADDIELAVDWAGDEGAFVAALVEFGFLDGEEGSYAIHDWAEHNPWSAGAAARSEKARWLSLCKHYGRVKAAELMPDYAASLHKSATSMQSADDSIQHADDSIHAAGDSMRDAPDSSAPLPSPSPSPLPSPLPLPSPSPPPTPTPSAPSAAVAPRPENRSPDETAIQQACRETWNAYSDAYQTRYGTTPVRNRTVNAQVKGFVERVGGAEGPQIAAWFVCHPGQFYVSRGHTIGSLLSDAEKLRTEWATDRVVTSGQARQSDRAGTTASNLRAILAARGETM